MTDRELTGVTRRSQGEQTSALPPSACARSEVAAGDKVPSAVGAGLAQSSMDMVSGHRLAFDSLEIGSCTKKAKYLFILT